MRGNFSRRGGEDKKGMADNQKSEAINGARFHPNKLKEPGKARLRQMLADAVKNTNKAQK